MIQTTQTCSHCGLDLTYKNSKFHDDAVSIRNMAISASGKNDIFSVMELACGNPLHYSFVNYQIAKEIFDCTVAQLDELLNLEINDPYRAMKITYFGIDEIDMSNLKASLETIKSNRKNIKKEVIKAIDDRFNKHEEEYNKAKEGRDNEYEELERQTSN